MDLAVAAAKHRGDEVGQLAGALQGLVVAAGDDGAGDLAAELFFAVLPQHVGDLALVGARQPVGRAFARLRVHAHVQRSVLAETETALGDVELRGRHTQVEKHAVEAGRGFIPLGHAGEGTAAGGDPPVRAEKRVRGGDRFRILVHHQQPSIRPQPVEHAARMAPSPERAIQIPAIPAYLQAIHDLRPHHREMAGLRSRTHPGHARHSLRSSMSSLISSSPMV